MQDGQPFIKNSSVYEYDDTGYAINTFASLISARVILGHDAQGQVYIYQVMRAFLPPLPFPCTLVLRTRVQIDGQSWARGASLYDLANKLISLGVVNAINLDGGGSATTVVNGTVMSAASDTCIDDPRFKCPRPVSTILCVRPAQKPTPTTQAPGTVAAPQQCSCTHTVAKVGVALFVAGLIVAGALVCCMRKCQELPHGRHLAYKFTRANTLAYDTLAEQEDNRFTLDDDEDELDDVGPRL
jgi:hypothetical protein